jgi:hypothetical protein
MDDPDYPYLLMAIRLVMLRISHHLKTMSETSFHSPALSVTLFMMSFTHTYFTPHDYKVKFDFTF